MNLRRLEAKDFRSLKQVEITFDRITVLIGENDAGKSSVLDLLEMVLGNRKPDTNDFFCWEESGDSEESKVRKQSEQIEAVVEFDTDTTDTAAQQFAIHNVLRIRKQWTQVTSEIYYWGRKLLDERLGQDFSKLKKPDLESLIEQLEPGVIESLGTNSERVAWLEQRARIAPTKEDWIPILAKVLDFLPRFERYRAMDYANPDTIVMKTLRQVFEETIYQPVTSSGQDRLLDKRLIEVRTDAERRIRDRVQELREYIARYAPRIRNISFDPTIDFAGGLKGGEFQIDDGRGFHYLSKTGDGTKRRVFMATLDWDRNVSIQQAQLGGMGQQIIRGYDEPDTNLHYEAQRTMYRAIADIAQTENSHIQAILCTHSLTMIDRAPAKSINLLRLQDNCTTSERLETDDDPEVEQFLAELAQELGITNTVMFYERCFILIEGDTEENALPALYRNLYHRSLLEDGIRIINTKSNGAVKEFLKLLSKNRQKLTIVFVDSDIKDKNSGRVAKLTADTLKQAGFPDIFIAERLRFIGTQEFEDAFSDICLAKALDLGYPRKDGFWEPDHISAIRNNIGKKFSNSLGTLVYSHSREDTPNWGKPELGKHLGRVCMNPDDVPDEIKRLFELARQVANCQ